MQLEEQSLTGKATMAEVSELVQVHLLFLSGHASATCSHSCATFVK